MVGFSHSTTLSYTTQYQFFFKKYNFKNKTTQDPKKTSHECHEQIIIKLKEVHNINKQLTHAYPSWTWGWVGGEGDERSASWRRLGVEAKIDGGVRQGQGHLRCCRDGTSHMGRGSGWRKGANLKYISGEVQWGHSHNDRVMATVVVGVVAAGAVAVWSDLETSASTFLKKNGFATATELQNLK